MAELNIQAIKDRVALGRKQGGNPTGGEDGPFHLYHLALNDLDTLIVAADPEEIAKRDARIVELEGQLAEAKAEHPSFQQSASVPVVPLASHGTLGGTSIDAIGTTSGKATTETFTPPRVAETTDAERDELLEVAKEHEG